MNFLFPVGEKVVTVSFDADPAYPLGYFLPLTEYVQKFESSVLCIFKKLEPGANSRPGLFLFAIIRTHVENHIRFAGSV